MNIFSSEHIFKSLSWEESSVCRALANCRQNAAHSGYRIRHKELLPYPIKSFVYHLFPCWQTCKLSKDTHYLWSEAEKNTALASSSTFCLYYKNIASSTEMVPRWDERLQNTSEREKELWKASRGRLKRSTACKRTNTGGVVFYSLQQIEAAEWDGATIWPQLRAMHCKSTKINGNNSTLDAHHYPDGVLGELQAT